MPAYRKKTWILSRTRILIIILLFLLGQNLSLFLRFDGANLSKILTPGDPNINISSPENKTYTESMSGYYPATYGFESEEDGSFPSYLTLLETYPVSVISSRTGHNKVLWFDDNGYSYRAGCKSNFGSNITYGTVELWFLIDDASDRTGLILRQDSNDSVNIGTRYDKWKYHTATELDLNIQRASGGDLPSPLNNVWYHISFAFESTTGNYMGLDQYTWKCWIDGIESAIMPFRNNISYMDNFYMSTSAAHTSYNMYIDSLGYSWDPDYNTGDNLNEGLLLGFNSNETLDWIGYSLDRNPNKTIIGNTTIPFPKYDGLHSIQVCGNDTLGTMFQSDIRYFTTKVFNLITPENVTYTEPMSGYYPATYGFENDVIGSDPDGWSVSEPGLQSVQVISGVDGHNNVLELFDTESGAGDIALVNNSFSPQTSGTIEFWYRTSGFLEDQTFRTEYNLDISIYFAVSSGNFEYYNASGWQVLAPHNNDQWYHIRFDFDCASDTYDFYLDGILIKSNLEFYTAVSSLDKLLFLTRQWGTSSDYYSYVDALGYSWDSNYNIGDNLNEGLLVSYENRIILDWIGYSLDGAVNKTILGNTTIPIPNNGIHKYQVFGNDSIGNLYHSEMQYFTVSLASNMYKPSLSDGFVSPLVGNQKTLFTFEVNYTDLDDNPPEFVKVIINETEYMMIKQNISDNNYTDGCIYQYSTYLNPSSYNYTYLFNCSDGIYSNSTSIFNNINVSKTNIFEPQLLFPDVSPDIGGYDTIFSYTVWYFDEDNNQPTVINITIDQNTYLMSKYDIYDSNSTDGIIYFYNTSLNIGYHQFQINCSDGKFENSTNWIDSPEVDPFYTDSDITLLNPLNMSSFFTGWVNFEWSSIEALFGTVNYTLQISNVSDFSEIVFEQGRIVELPSITGTLINVVFPAGIYYWRVYPVFESYIGNWSESFTFNLIANYFEPILNFDSVTPTIGDQFTLFNFTISYFDQDNNTPSFLNVNINGSLFAMDKVNSLDIDYTDGCIFQYLTTLPFSSQNYTYSFNCSDGRYSTASPVFNNLEVNPANYYAPQLLYPQVSPQMGGLTTTFEFKIWYHDEDSNLPTSINITIDNTVFSMVQFNLADINAIDGILFYYNTSFDFGFYSFQVNCSDGKFTNSTGWINGPIVNPLYDHPPVLLLDPVYNANLPAGWINFSWISLDPSYGSLNYTLQISNQVSFGMIIYEIIDIPETPATTEIQLNINLPSGIFYWRVKPIFGLFEGNWSNEFKLNIIRNSFAPILISDTIFPLTGNQNTIFKFTAIYQDIDNNAPVSLRIIINGTPFLMEKENPNDTNYTDGCVYQFLTLLMPSEQAYTYSFECFDGIFYNSTSSYQGPIVSNEVTIYDRDNGLNNREMENILAICISLILSIGIIFPSIIITEIKIKKTKSQSISSSKTKSKLKKIK